MLKSLIFRELSISLVGYFFTQILLRYTTLKKMISFCNRNQKTVVFMVLLPLQVF